jgi:cytoskeletal protein RodZ
VKELPDKDKNLQPTQISIQGKTTFTPATRQKKSSGPKGPWLLGLLVIVLLITAVTGWLLYALNRPPIEISNDPSLAPTSPAQTTQPLQPTIAQASRSASTNPTTAAPSRAATISTTNTPNPKIQGYGVVISKVLNLRSAPNTDATVIKSLKSGDIVELTSRNGGWYQTSDGLWISASYMEVRQTRPEAESYARELASS